MRRNYDDAYVGIKGKCDYIMRDYMQLTNITKIGFKDGGDLSEEQQRKRMMDLNDDYAETERLQAMFAKGTNETLDINR